MAKQSHKPYIQGAGGGIPPPEPPGWLGSLRASAIHLQGDLWDVKIPSLGGSWIGPYNQLTDYIKKQGYAGTLQAAHIVGGEHLQDIGSAFSYEEAPCVAVDKALHSTWTTGTTHLQSKTGPMGGRTTKTEDRPKVSKKDVIDLYKELYRAHPELQQIAKNIINLPNHAQVKSSMRGSPSSMPKPVSPMDAHQRSTMPKPVSSMDTHQRSTMPKPVSPMDAHQRSTMPKPVSPMDAHQRSTMPKPISPMDAHQRSTSDIPDKEGNNISQPGNFRTKIGNAAKWILKTGTSIIVEEILVNILSYAIRKIFGIKSFEEKLNDKLKSLESKVNEEINREIEAKSEWIEWSFRSFPGKNIHVRTVIGYEHWDNELYRVWLHSVDIDHDYRGNFELPQNKKFTGRLSKVESITNHFQLILPRDVFGTWMFSRHLKGTDLKPYPCGIFWIKLVDDQIEISGVGISIRPFLPHLNEVRVSDDRFPNNYREGIYIFEELIIDNVLLRESSGSNPNDPPKLSFKMSSERSDKTMNLTFMLHNRANVLSVVGDFGYKVKFHGNLIRAAYEKNFNDVRTTNWLQSQMGLESPDWAKMMVSGSIRDFKNYYYQLYAQKKPRGAHDKDLVHIWDMTPKEKIGLIPKDRVQAPLTFGQKLVNEAWKTKFRRPPPPIKKPERELIRSQLPVQQRYTEYYMDRMISSQDNNFLTPPDLTLYFNYENRYEDKVLVDKTNIIEWAKADPAVVYPNIRNGRIFIPGNPSKEKEAREYWYQFLKSNENLWKKDLSQPVAKIISRLYNGVTITPLNYKGELKAYINTIPPSLMEKYNNEKIAFGYQLLDIYNCLNSKSKYQLYFYNTAQAFFNNNSGSLSVQNIPAFRDASIAIINMLTFNDLKIA